uniref:Jumonji domain containing 8 n=1 Tax=Pseudonaja textilis TaxID=8673 RepID=A0A670Y4D0_PSETE
SSLSSCLFPPSSLLQLLQLLHPFLPLSSSSSSSLPPSSSPPLPLFLPSSSPFSSNFSIPSSPPLPSSFSSPSPPPVPASFSPFSSNASIPSSSSPPPPRYAFSRPVILQGLTDNTEFQTQCTKDHLLARFGEHLVRLSTANTYSYRKVDLPFQDYVDHLLEPQDMASLGSETLYFFGDNNFTEWGSLFKKYNPPPFRIPGTTGAYSFGIGGSGSGVPFHWHGPGFSEVIFGRKHWFLYPPEKTPAFHPNRTTLSWFLDTYPSLPPWEKPLECTIHPGEAGCCGDVHKPEVAFSQFGLVRMKR